MAEASERCETCRFWKQLEWVPHSFKDGEQPGDCRRRAPVIVQRVSGVTTEYPCRSKDEWCGEWEANAETNAAMVAEGLAALTESR